MGVSSEHLGLVLFESGGASGIVLRPTSPGLFEVDICGTAA